MSSISFLCVQCRHNIQGSPVVLSPCSHQICVGCALSNFPSLPPDEHFVCASCCQQVSSSTYEEKKTFHRQPIRNVYKNPRSDIDPVRSFLKNYNKDEQEGRAFIFFGSGAEGLKTIQSNFKLSKGNINQEKDDNNFFDCFTTEESETIKSNNKKESLHQYTPCSEIDKENLLLIARTVLHQIFFCNRKKNNSLTPTIPDFISYHTNNPSFEVEFCFNLATGCKLDNQTFLDIQKPSYLRSIFLGCAVGYEMLLRAGQDYPSRLQTALGNTLYSLSRDRRVVEMLSDLRLSSSWKNLYRKQWKSVSEMVAKEIKPEPFSFIVPSLDNLDFVKKGSNASVDSWIVSNLDIIPSDVLKQKGFLQKNPEERIPRNRKSLDDIINSTAQPDIHPADNILMPTHYDLEVFSYLCLQQCDTIISLNLPTINEANKMIRDNNFINGIEKYSRFPKNLGIDLRYKETPLSVNKERIPRLPKKFSTENETDHNTLFDMDDEGIDVFISWLEAGHTLLDYPQKINLNKRESVEQYMAYIADIYRQKIDADISAMKPGDERPVQELLMPICADGSPIYQMGRILREKSDDYLDIPLRGCLGGFHVILEILNKKNELFEEFNRSIVKLYRKGDRKQDWVLFPRDPRQAEEEAVPLLAAIYRSAADAVAGKKGRMAVSAKEVVNHMVVMAAKKPIANAMLCDLRLLEVYFLLRNSEKAGCIDWFIAALRLMLPLFASTNAYKYVDICSDFLVWWETESEATKVLVENFVFTRPTPDGKRIYTDRRQEIFNKLFRDEVGRDVYPGLDNRMFEVAMSLQSLQESKKINSIIRGKKFSKQKKNFNNQHTERILLKNFILVYSKLTSMRIWWEDKDIILNSKDGNVIRASSTNLQNFDGEEINSDLLRFQKIGSDRIRDYFMKWLWLNTGKVDRPHSEENGGVDLSRIKSTSKQQNAMLERLDILSTSTDLDKLTKACQKKKRPILEQIDKMVSILQNNDLLNKDDEEQYNNIKQNFIKLSLKGDILPFLIASRKKIFSVLPEIKSNIRKTIYENGSNLSRTSEEDRLTHLDNTFYKLDHGTKQFYNNRIEIGKNNR